MRNIIIVAVLSVMFLACNKEKKEDIKWDEIKTKREGLDHSAFNNKLFDDADELLVEWHSAQQIRDHGNSSSAEQRLLDIVRGHFSEFADALSDGKARERIISSASLGFSNDIRSIPYLLSALNDENSKVRHNAAMSIGSIAYPDTPMEVLLASLDTEKDNKVRGMLYYALFRTAKEDEDDNVNNLSYLMKGLDEEAAAARNYAVMGLGVIGNLKAANVIAEKNINDKNPTVRHTSILTLGKIGNKSFVPEVKKKLNDPVAPVRIAAAFVLKKWTGEEYNVEFAGSEKK